MRRVVSRFVVLLLYYGAALSHDSQIHVDGLSVTRFIGGTSAALTILFASTKGLATGHGQDLISLGDYQGDIALASASANDSG